MDQFQYAGKAGSSSMKGIFSSSVLAENNGSVTCCELLHGVRLEVLHLQIGSFSGIAACGDLMAGMFGRQEMGLARVFPQRQQMLARQAELQKSLDFIDWKQQFCEDVLDGRQAVFSMDSSVFDKFPPGSSRILRRA